VNIVGIIPARMASTRFPGKPLCKMCGMTMIEHVYRRSAMCGLFKELYVATCDEEIAEEVNAFGGKAIMTSNSHKTCTDRVAEAYKKIKSDAEIIVNIQGDEPLIYPEMIEKAVTPFFEDETLQCTNVISKIDDDEDFYNPNTIKVVKDCRDYALYFSREAIPSSKKQKSPYGRYKQVCILPFRKNFLLKFVQMNTTPLESVESIDMMRILENGYKIKLVETKFKTKAVDNEEDRRFVEKLIAEDELFRQYKDIRG